MKVDCHFVFYYASLLRTRVHDIILKKTSEKRSLDKNTNLSKIMTLFFESLPFNEIKL